MDSDFYLISDESSIIEIPRTCHPEQRVSVGARNDWWWVQVDPPVPGKPYRLSEPEIRRVMIAVRAEGYSLENPTLWPIPVYIALPKVPPALRYDRSDLVVLDWGELHRTYEAAHNAIVKRAR